MFLTFHLSTFISLSMRFRCDGAGLKSSLTRFSQYAIFRFWTSDLSLKSVSQRFGLSGDQSLNLCIAIWIGVSMDSWIYRWSRFRLELMGASKVFEILFLEDIGLLFRIYEVDVWSRDDMVFLGVSPSIWHRRSSPLELGIRRCGASTEGVRIRFFLGNLGSFNSLLEPLIFEGV